jgi:probable HAF family extracellular repeat protein
MALVIRFMESVTASVPPCFPEQPVVFEMLSQNNEAAEARMRWIAVASVVIMTVPGWARADDVELIDLSSFVSNATDTAAFDVNPSGVVVGTVRVEGGEQQVARWTATNGAVLDSIFGSESPQAVSASGVIVGTYLGTGTGWYYRDGAFDCIPLPDPCGSFNNIWRASSGRDLNRHDVFTGSISPPPDHPANAPVEAYLGSFAGDGSVVIRRLGAFQGEGTRGNGLNDADEVVGVTGSGLDTTALLFRDGSVIALPDVGGGYNWAEAINNDGFAVGIASRPDPGVWPYDAEAALWDTRSDPITVGLLGRLPGHRLSRATDINAGGTIVGFSVDAEFADQRAVAWIDGQLLDLNTLLPPGSDWHLEVATAVNDAGLMVGYGRRDGLAGRRAFLLRPVPLFASDFEGGGLSGWDWGAGF